MKFYKVHVDPARKTSIVDPHTFRYTYDHMKWCANNCESIWFNECNDYSYVCFSDTKDALKFAMAWSSLTDEELFWLTLEWS